ncbi:MAG: hypothetical protein ACK4UJ_05610 [Leptonema sp. (in: bacteria)]
MLRENHYKMNQKHQFCIYIQPHLYRFLKIQSRGNLSLFKEYLIQKYKASLLSQKQVAKLKNASCQYQPKTKNYKRIILRNIEPELWKRLKEIKSFTGYSISFTIRVMLEWEMQSKNIPIAPLIPALPTNQQRFFYPNSFVPLNQYMHYQMVGTRPQ